MPCLRLRLISLKAGSDVRSVEALLRSVPGVYGAFAHAHELYIELDFEDDEVSVAELMAVLHDAGHAVRMCG